MTRQITVEGMSCGGCEEAVENALKNVPGVTDADADNETDTVTIEGDAPDQEIVTAVEGAGYQAKA